MLVRGHKVYNTPYANIYTLAKDYEYIENPTPEQERLQAMLQSVALQLQGKQPIVSQHQSQGGSQGHSQRVSAHDKLSPLMLRLEEIMVIVMTGAYNGVTILVEGH
jgi:hypothetical protein